MVLGYDHGCNFFNLRPRLDIRTFFSGRRERRQWSKHRPRRDKIFKSTMITSLSTTHSPTEGTFFDVSQYAFFGKDVVELEGCHSSSLGVFKM
nr:uncharacterized protein LOC112025036 isoform X2 [Quercus suber]